MHSEYTPLQPHPLPLHGAVLSRHGCAGARARFRNSLLGLLRLVGIGLCHFAWKQTHLVGHRADVGQILVRRCGYFELPAATQLFAQMRSLGMSALPPLSKHDGRPRDCRRTPACSFTTAEVAGNASSRGRGIAVCSVRTARCRARRCKRHSAASEHRSRAMFCHVRSSEYCLLSSESAGRLWMPAIRWGGQRRCSSA